jgi:hypothetical protein
MPTFGSAIFGSPGADGSNVTVGVSLTEIVMAAYRIAGITQRARIGPSDDMYAEAIPALSRMLGLYNCDGHKIYTTSISAPFPFTPGQKVYTIGPGGDFDTDRPLFIRGANILFPTSPVVRRHVEILDDNQWRAIRVQDVPGAPPYALYYDGGLDSNGRGQIYLRFQPPAGYSLELYTWQRLQTSFSSRDDVAVFPDGYELALVYNLAKHLAALNPNMANMSPDAYRIADSSLATLISLNTRSPRINPEPALDSGDYGPGYGWLDGGIQ